MTSHSLYNKNKRDYLNLNKNSQIGGTIDENTYKNSKFHNLYHYFDKGSNNIWIEQQKDRKTINDIPIKTATPEAFDKFLTDTMSQRYHARISALKNLLNTMKIGVGDEEDVINLDFLDKFYQYLFKGTAFKKYFNDEKEITPEIKLKFKIFTEFTDDQSGGLPKKKFYIFEDRANPCHLIKILKDEFNRDDKSSSIKYGFINVKELGRGAAGTASLFSYHDGETDHKLQIAAKLMASTQFKITNDGGYLPLEIGYVSNTHKQDSSYFKESGSTIGTSRNTRFLYTPTIINYIDSFYNNYSKYNIFKIKNSTTYTNVLLSVSSDNFSNQTIMHMILEIILNDPKYESQHNYIKQYDAMLCYNTEQTFDTNEAKTWLKYFADNANIAYDYVGKKLNFVSPKIDGLNFMEVANSGDLYGHLFDVQKDRFAEIREVSDLTLETFHELNEFLNEMIMQLLKPMSVLQHPKHAFVHGDFKSKNVFVSSSTGKDSAKKTYTYKIADYDKSSINFNGIRFYNSGNSFVKKYMNTVGPKRYDNYTFDAENKPSDSDIQNIKAKIDRGEEISDDEQKKLTPSYMSIDEIVKRNELNDVDKLSLIYAFIIRDIKKPNSNLSSISEVKLIEKDNLNLYKKLQDMLFSVCKYLSKNNTNKNLEEIIEDTNDKYIEYLKKLYDSDENHSVNFDLFYSLTSALTYASSLFSQLENIEVEQLYVRYQPIPFFHTIDLYTLFLSLLQSPMIHVFLKYCINKKDENHVKTSIFWNSFYDLWTNDNDVYTILGYYDYLFQSPNVVDIDKVGTIGFILDPIKKNEILLVRSVGDNYWDRVWDNKYKDIKNYIERSDPENKQITQPRKQPALPIKAIKGGGSPVHELELSKSSALSFTMPNIKLSNCGNFNMRLHRDGKSYYVNKNIIVYSIPTLTEKLVPIFSSKQGSKEAYDNSIKTLKQELYTNLFNYVSQPDVKTEILRGSINVKNVSGTFVDDIFVAEQVKDFIPTDTEIMENMFKFEFKNSEIYKNYLNSLDLNQIKKILSDVININSGLINDIKTQYVSGTLSAWYITNFTQDSVIKELLFNPNTYENISRILELYMMIASNGYYDASKELDKFRELLLVISKSNIVKNIDIGDKYSDILKKFDDIKNRMYEELKSKYMLFIKEQNSKNKEAIDAKNAKKEKEIEATKKLANESADKKYELLIAALKKAADNATSTDKLDDYIKQRSGTISGTALKTLTNICKTNLYKDVFHNIQNWDYCNIMDEELKRILAEVSFI
jgi:hypothetical protein